jgi:uncharacterized membrane protein (DUF2068 family)
VSEKPARGVRAIIAYKAVKASVQLGLALLLALLWPFGLPEWLSEFAFALRHHTTHGWAIRLADLLAGSSSKRRILLTIVALALDGAFTALEAWALRTGKWWGPWLVVAATSSLLPFELYELWRVPRASRALILALNLVIVVYLARRARHERRTR